MTKSVIHQKIFDQKYKVSEAKTLAEIEDAVMHLQGLFWELRQIDRLYRFEKMG